MTSRPISLPSERANGAPANRRNLIVGAGVAGAAAIAAKALPLVPADVAKPAVQKASPDEQGGYQLTQHVLRYYETTKV